MSIQAAAAMLAGKPLAAGAQAAGSEDELRVWTREARLGSQAAFSAIFERFQGLSSIIFTGWWATGITLTTLRKIPF